MGRSMKLASKIILCAPVSDESLLPDFVERCLADAVSLVAIVGPDCERLEDFIDSIIIGDGGNTDRFLVTTSHPHETFADVTKFVESWKHSKSKFQEIHL